VSGRAGPPPARLSSDHPLAQDLDHVLAHTREVWASLRGARIFVTGATGFFGKWLLESFVWANDSLELGSELVALTRNPAAFRAEVPHITSSAAVTLQQGDQRDFVFPSGRFDAVIHAGVEYGPPLPTFERNFLGTRRVLEFARAAGARRFLFISSGAVYGTQPPEMEQIHEDYPGNLALDDPANAYGLSKRASEHLGHLQDGLDFMVARGFTFVGPYLPSDRPGAMGNFVADALRGGPINVKGDGTALRAYLYGADLAIWLWTILERGTPGGVYNVGGETVVSIRELAEKVVSVLAPQAEIRMGARPTGGLPARYLPDVTRARDELGLRARIHLDEAIRRSGSWATRAALNRTSP
jgi:dTDP-glucose 4,6-dehydratase